MQKNWLKLYKMCLTAEYVKHAVMWVSCDMQQVSEIATSQVQSVQMQQESRDKELTSLRQQLVDFQAQSNEKTVIG